MLGSLLIDLLFNRRKMGNLVRKIGESKIGLYYEHKVMRSGRAAD